MSGFVAFCPAVFEVSPVVWATIPVLCCSVLVGVGMQGLCWTTSKDKNWLLVTAATVGAFCIITLLVGMKETDIYLNAAKMYGLAVLMVLIIFFVSIAKLRAHWLRWLVLCSAMCLDIFIGVQSIVDKMF